MSALERSEWCSTVSARDEPLPGSATVVGGWVLLEHPGPWGRDIFDGVAFEAELTAALKEKVDGAGLRMLLIRRPGRDDPGRTGHTVYLAAADPRHQWLERLTVARPEQLLDLDLGRVAGPAPGIGTAVAEPMMLVCTHGRRDRCCAVDGRPIAAALAEAGRPVWECSHTGGHRFAAVSIALPTGYNYGRLTPDEAIGVARGLAAGRVPLIGLRGRSCYDPHAQAAEVAVRRAEDAAGREYGPDGLEVGTPRQHDDGTFVTVVSRPDGRQWSVRTEVDTLPARAVSCGADPKPVHPIRVVAVDPR